MPHKEKNVYVNISIELDSYEIANLREALKLVPPNGEWMQQILTKIIKGIQAQGIDPETFYYKPNLNMDVEFARRHLNHIEHRSKHFDGEVYIAKHREKKVKPLLPILEEDDNA